MPTRWKNRDANELAKAPRTTVTAIPLSRSPEDQPAIARRQVAPIAHRLLGAPSPTCRSRTGQTLPDAAPGRVRQLQVVHKHSRAIWLSISSPATPPLDHVPLHEKSGLRPYVGGWGVQQVQLAHQNIAGLAADIDDAQSRGLPWAPLQEGGLCRVEWLPAR